MFSLHRVMYLSLRPAEMCLVFWSLKVFGRLQVRVPLHFSILRLTRAVWCVEESMWRTAVPQWASWKFEHKWNKENEIINTYVVSWLYLQSTKIKSRWYKRHQADTMRAVVNNVQITFCILLCWFNKSAVNSIKTSLKFSRFFSQSLITKSSWVYSWKEIVLSIKVGNCLQQQFGIIFLRETTQKCTSIIPCFIWTTAKFVVTLQSSLSNLLYTGIGAKPWFWRHLRTSLRCLSPVKWFSRSSNVFLFSKDMSNSRRDLKSLEF